VTISLMTSLTCPRTLRKQRIEVTGLCCRNKHPAAFF